MAADSQFWTDNSFDGACAWTDNVTTEDAALQATSPPHHCEDEEAEEPKPDEETERELKRCKGGCGCYGTEANQGYCSKCTASGQDSDEQVQRPRALAMQRLTDGAVPGAARSSSSSALARRAAADGC